MPTPADLIRTAEPRRGGGVGPRVASFEQVVGGPRPEQESPEIEGLDPQIIMLIKLLMHALQQGGIPQMALGGVVRRPTLAMVGEAGPEAVVPLGGASPARLGSPGGGLLRGGRSRGGVVGGSDPGSIVSGLLSGNRAALGPDYLRNSLRRRAQRTSDATRRRSATLSRLSGLDPTQQRQAMVDADIEASGGLAGALNDADLQGGADFQSFMRQLLSGERGIQADAAAAEKARGGGFGSFLGSAIGGGLSGGLTKLIGGK